MTRSHDRKNCYAMFGFQNFPWASDLVEYRLSVSCNESDILHVEIAWCTLGMSFYINLTLLQFGYRRLF